MSSQSFDFIYLSGSVDRCCFLQGVGLGSIYLWTLELEKTQTASRHVDSILQIGIERALSLRTRETCIRTA